MYGCNKYHNLSKCKKLLYLTKMERKWYMYIYVSFCTHYKLTKMPKTRMLTLYELNNSIVHSIDTKQLMFVIFFLKNLGN